MNRLDLLAHLIRRRSYRSLLEIGCADDPCYRRLPLLDVTGVDPGEGGTVKAYSHRWWPHQTRTWDLVFVDGDHRAEGVLYDCLQALSHLKPGGAVVVHDLLPTNPRQMVWPGDEQRRYLGDGWRTFASLVRHPRLDGAVGDFDWGCGVLFNRPNPAGELLPERIPPWRSWTWETYELARDLLFPILTEEQLCQWIN